jgi:alkylation response protein AidB-like acyl-CoA dehydrogenase
VMEACRLARLTRNQHVLLRLGALAAAVEGAAALARRAARSAEGTLSPKASRRFDAATLAAMSRVNAREVAMTVLADGVRWVAGADGADPAELESRFDQLSIHAAQSGLIADMDSVADHLYGRG